MKASNLTLHDTWLLNSVKGWHYTTVQVTVHAKIGSLRSKQRYTALKTAKVVIKVADSNNPNPTLDLDLRNGIDFVVKSLFHDHCFEEGLGIQIPLQDSLNNCGFHTILFQGTVLSW
jgi:hypothetical protein